MKFSAEKVETRLAQELVSCEGALDYLGWDLGDHLVTPPQSLRFFSPPPNLGKLWLWALLDEEPDSRSEGRWVVFNPRAQGHPDGAFGLATKPRGNRLGVFLGYQPSLSEALWAIYESWRDGRWPGLDPGA